MKIIYLFIYLIATHGNSTKRLGIKSLKLVDRYLNGKLRRAVILEVA